jgi:stearoyl-CoA desaturase (delta-9 desaturase)
MGVRRFSGQDESRNSWLLAFLAWGEGWHNNHHAFPASASFGLDWWRFDPSFWLIKGLELVGLAKNVRTPPREKIVQREAGYAGP